MVSATFDTGAPLPISGGWEPVLDPHAMYITLEDPAENGRFIALIDRYVFGCRRLGAPMDGRGVMARGARNRN